jgi:hypothetical protein
MTEQGMYEKYTVTNVRTGEIVKDCFILRPGSDPHAIPALRAYAGSVKKKDPQLSDDLTRWLNRLEGKPDKVEPETVNILFNGEPMEVPAVIMVADLFYLVGKNSNDYIIGEIKGMTVVNQYRRKGHEKLHLKNGICLITTYIGPMTNA